MELILNADAIEILADLTPATRHKVLDAAVHYCKTGEMPTNFSSNVMALFRMLIALSKAEQSSSKSEAVVSQHTKRPDNVAEQVKKGLYTILNSFTQPQYLSDKERKEEQELMLDVRDQIMDRYNALRV